MNILSLHTLDCSDSNLGVVEGYLGRRELLAYVYAVHVVYVVYDFLLIQRIVIIIEVLY